MRRSKDIRKATMFNKKKYYQSYRIRAIKQNLARWDVSMIS